MRNTKGMEKCHGLNKLSSDCACRLQREQPTALRVKLALCQTASCGGRNEALMNSVGAIVDEGVENKVD